MSKINDLQLSRICVSLQSEEKGRRKKALEELNSRVFDGELTVEAYFDLWEIVSKHVTRSLTDDTEFCRNCSIEIWKKCLTVLPVNEKNIIHLMTIMSRRLSAQELLETSEEVRLNCVTLLRLIIHKYKKCLSVYYQDLVAIFARTVTDNYPKIKRETCLCIEDLAKSIPEQFYSRSGTLVKPTLSNFTHQHWKVRVASVRAVGQIILYGNGKSMEEVSTPMAERLFDQSGAVRLAIVEVAGLWLLQLRDRYSWWHKLLPLLVTGLHDEIEHIRNRAGELWRQVGEVYMKENESDEKLKIKLDFLIEDPTHYPPNVERPNLGCRVIVQQNLCKLVAGITRELGDWLADIRVRSAQLLCVLVLNAEHSVTQHVEKLLRGMYRAGNDADPRVVENVELAAEYIGYFVPPSIYCHLFLTTLDEIITAGHLRIFAAILRGSDGQSLRPKLPEIGKFLQQSHICKSQKSGHQQQLVRCCESLIRICQKDCADISQELFEVLFTLVSTCQEDKSVSLAENLLEELGRIEGLSGLDQLFVSHLRPILIDLLGSCKAWTIYSVELHIFQLSLTRAAIATSRNIDIVLPLLKTTMSNDSDQELRLKLFILVADYFQQRNVTLRHVEEKHLFIDSILRDVIFPGLVWSAGRAAEAIRTAAICCLCALLDDKFSKYEKIKRIIEISCTDKSEGKNDNDKSKNDFYSGLLEDASNTGTSIKNIGIVDTNVELFENAEEFSDLFGKIVPVLVSLVDDNAKKTRLYALRAICLVIDIGKKSSLVSDGRINEIYPVILKRLDDGSDDVRVAAIESLVVIWGARTKDYDVNFNASHVDFLYTTAMIHLDDPDEKFQSLMLDALIEFAKVHPGLLLRKIVSSKGNFRNKTSLNKLSDHCHSLLREGKL